MANGAIVMNSGPSGDPCPDCDDPMFKVRAPSGDVFQECMSCEYSEEPRVSEAARWQDVRWDDIRWGARHRPFQGDAENPNLEVELYDLSDCDDEAAKQPWLSVVIKFDGCADWGFAGAEPWLLHTCGPKDVARLSEAIRRAFYLAKGCGSCQSEGCEACPDCVCLNCTWAPGPF